MNKVDESVVNDLQNLLTLIRFEREYEQNYYNQTLSQLGFQEKEKLGLCWSNVYTTETGYGMGDYPFLVLENRRLIPNHRLEAGKPVKLYNKDDSNTSMYGQIHWMDEAKLKIVFYMDELPDWCYDHPLAVEAVFDNRTYDVMESTLSEVINAKNCRLVELANTIYGLRDMEISSNTFPGLKNKLNESQKRAVEAIYQANDVAYIHGPPGTGKTTTLVEAVKSILENESDILVATPSNAAADHIAQCLDREGLNVVRVGNLSRINDELISLTVEGRLSNHSRLKELNGYKWKAAEYRKLASKYKRSFGPEERKQRSLLYKESRAYSKDARDLEDYLVKEIIDKADIIVTTLIGAKNKYLEHRHFDTVIIDEAAQALEPACWVPISMADKVIMAGDPMQLPPTIKSDQAIKGGLGRTLMEKGIEFQPDASFLLDVQYRMNNQIMAFSNKMFYKNMLKADASVANRALILGNKASSPVEFVDMAGCGFSEQVDPETGSLYNDGELGVLKAHHEMLVKQLPKDVRPTIAIISPYRSQVTRIKKAFEEEGKADQMRINTIDSFQGQEVDIVYLSLVRSNEKGEVGFLKDYRRLNVALTRAKLKVIVIGDSSTLAVDKFYSDFLEFCESECLYDSAYSYLFS